jgi:hypothetical protein
MEADDLLCSRNARPQKALARGKARLGALRVGRVEYCAQWKINQPPSLRREQASVEGSIVFGCARPMRAVIG